MASGCPTAEGSSLSNVPFHLETAKEGTPAGLKAKAREKVLQPAQKAPGTGRREGAKTPLSHTKMHSLHHPPNFKREYHITLFPEKIYLSICLEPRKNNNILHEKRHKYPTIPYIIFWESARKLYFSKSFLEEVASERAKDMSRGVSLKKGGGGFKGKETRGKGALI